MTPLVLTIIPFGILLGAFFLIRFYLAKQPDRLVARHRALGVFIWIVATVLLVALALRYLGLGFAPTGYIGSFMALMLVFAIWQRRRLSRELGPR